MINVNLLPKNLRRVREPGYWKVLMVGFPVVVLAIAGALQWSAERTYDNLVERRQQLEDERATLQQFINQQREVQARLRQLQEVIAIFEQVQTDRIAWTAELGAMLETLPTGTVDGLPAIDFASLSMEAVVPPRQDPLLYEGRPIVAEMSVSGTVANAEVLAQFVRSLEDSSQYGVAFQNATLDEETGTYRYDLDIGAIGRDER